MAVNQTESNIIRLSIDLPPELANKSSRTLLAGQKPVYEAPQRQLAPLSGAVHPSAYSLIRSGQGDANMGIIGCNEGVLQLEITIKRCRKYREWPIHVEDTTGRYYLDRSWTTRVCWSSQCGLSLLLLGFLIFRELEALMSEAVVIPQVIFMQLLVVIHLVAVYSNAAIYFNGEHTVSALNMAISVFKAYEG